MYFPLLLWEQSGVKKFHFKLLARTHYGNSSLVNGWEAEGRKFLQQGEDMGFHKAAQGRYVHKYSAWCGDDNCKFTSRTVETTKSHVVSLARWLGIRRDAVNKTACYFLALEPVCKQLFIITDIQTPSAWGSEDNVSVLSGLLTPHVNIARCWNPELYGTILDRSNWLWYRNSLNTR